MIGRLLEDRPNDEIFVATKAGRRLDPHTAEGYNHENLSAFVERSLKNLGVEALDLLQLHCPPTEAYSQDSTFEALDRLQEAGKIRNYGVSVEKVEEARMALSYPNVRTVQIIFNIFRQKPAEEFFPLAEERNIGILARVPLASGLLSGKMSADRAFAEDDHRNFNREGEAFDRGETFSGVDFETGLGAAEELKELVPDGHTLAQFALRWILMHPAVSCAIPGGKNPSQVEDNVAAAGDAPALGRDHAAGAGGLRRVRPRGGPSPVVGEALPRHEYPRPQFRRQNWTNLNGEWHFAFDDSDFGLAEGWQNVTVETWRSGGSPFDRRIIVPFCYQSRLSGIGETAFHDVVWYARTFEHLSGRERSTAAPLRRRGLPRDGLGQRRAGSLARRRAHAFLRGRDDTRSPAKPGRTSSWCGPKTPAGT